MVHQSFAYIGTGEGREAPIFIADEVSLASVYESGDKFLIPEHYQEDVASVMIPRGLATDRIEKLAMDIKRFYGNEELHLVCILKGSRGFFSELASCLNRLYAYTEGHSRPPYMEHYVRIKSYVDTTSTNRVNIMSGDLCVLKNKNVLIVEDIIDSGRTLKTFCRSLIDYNVKSVRVAALLEKRSIKSNGFQGDFVGFSIPNIFIAGYCIDYNEMFRDLDHVVVLKNEAIEKYKSSSN